MTSWTAVYWGPVVEADVVLASLRAAGVPAELVYQSTAAGAVPAPGPTDSRVVVPNDYVQPATALILRASKKQRDLGATTATRPKSPSIQSLALRAVAVLFLAGILWSLVNMMVPGVSRWWAWPI